METVDSTNGPPKMNCSIDMGMADESICTRSGSIDTSCYPIRRQKLQKKQVVLKRNHTRGYSVNMSQKFMQSQPQMLALKSQATAVTADLMD